jgi:hypothetical protein
VKKKFYQLKLKPVIDMESNKIVYQIFFLILGDREAAILEKIKFNLRDNSSVILIDEFLKPFKSFLKDKFQN